MADEENQNNDQNQEEQEQNQPTENQGTPSPGEEPSGGSGGPSKGMIIGGLIVFVAILFLAQKYIHFGEKGHKGPASHNESHHNKSTLAPVVSKVPSAPAVPSNSNSMHAGESVVPKKSVSNANQAHQPSNKEIQDMIGKYIEDNPEVVAKALQNLNEKMDKQRVAKSKNYLKDNIGKITENKLYLGNPRGQDVIVEFFDYKCSYCRRSHLVMEQVIKNYPNVKLVLIPIPMLGQHSAEAVRSAMAVWHLSRKHFAEFHEALINSQNLDENTINAIAAKIGISSDSLSREMKDPVIQKMIEENLEIAQNIGIRGVPTFIVKGELVPGSLSYEGFKEMLDKHNKKM